MIEQDFCKLFSRYALYYDKKWSDAEITTIARMYFESLKTFSLTEALSAFKKHSESGASGASGAYFPRINELVRILGVEKKRSSELSWASVERFINQVGIQRGVRVCFDDEITMRVIDDFGGLYRMICDERERCWLARDFKTRYDAYAQSQNIEQWPAFFVASKTYDYDDVDNWQLMLIGNETAAKNVHESAQNSNRLPAAAELAQRLRVVK